MLFGVNNLAPVLLKILGVDVGDIPRFRDCYLDDGHIIIFTRTGGGNRDYYDYPDDCEGPSNDDLREIKGYVDDWDDSFDCTYAYFVYEFPEEWADDLKALEAQDESHTPSEKWKNLFAAMDKEIEKKKNEN